MRSISRTCSAFALVALAIVALYAMTGTFDFIHTDDPDYVFANPFVAGGLSWANVRAAFTSLTHGAVWMPLTWLSYQLTITLFGVGAGAQHLVNVALHVANAWLLMLLMDAACRPRLQDAAPVGISPVDAACRPRQQDADPVDAVYRPRLFVLLALLWALHPQRIEAVAWIASRKELLWTFFTLIGLLAWRRGRLVATYLCCALACLSKPTAMVFPLLALVIRSPCRRGLQAASLPLWAMAVATGVVALFSQTHPQGMGELSLYYAPLWERAVNAANAVGLYLAQMLVPVGIHLDYHFVHGLPNLWFIGLPVFALAVAGTVMFVLQARQRRTGTCLGASLFFLIPLLPTLGLLASFGTHARADRFLYLPAMALPLALAPIVLGSPRPRLWLGWLAIVVLAYAGLSVAPLRAMRNTEAAYARTLEYEPENPAALAHVGEISCANGKLDEGLTMLVRARAVEPSADADARYAYALMRRGTREDLSAIRALFAEREPFLPKALEALGTAELAAGEWKSADDHLTAAILSPRRTYSAEDARLKLAYAWHNGGRRAEARKLFEQLLASPRRDLAEKAETAYGLTVEDPGVVLFW